MSIASEIQRLQTAKEDITRALSRIGYDIPSGMTIDEYAEILDPITKGKPISYLQNPNNYLSFKFVENGKFYWKTTNSSFNKVIQYCKNGGSWVSFTSTTTGYVCDVVAGDEIWVKGTTTSMASSSQYCSFFNEGLAYVSGNINSLINFGNVTDYCFRFLFKNCNIDIDENNMLILPSTTVKTYSYQYMFDNCTNLTTAPALPATTLANYCYYGMFRYCSSLRKTPQLPATEVGTQAYGYMFFGCTNLIQAPELPATTVGTQAYYYMFGFCSNLKTPMSTLPASFPATSTYNYACMFYNCTNLETAPSLPATALTNYCYQYMFYNCLKLETAPELPSTTLATGCYQYMFQGCNNLTTAPSTIGTNTTVMPASACVSMFTSCVSLITAPELPATSLGGASYYNMFYGCAGLTTAPKVLPAKEMKHYCYYRMFYGCASLTTAPELPATTLGNACYYQMFRNCTSLNYIKCLATNISATNCTTNWVSGVSQTGTFVKDPNMTGWTRGNNGIPTNWTDYQEVTLTFNIISGGTINWAAADSASTKTIEYKLNDGEWTSITSNTGSSAPSISVNNGDIVQFRGNNATYSTNTSQYNTFSSSTAKFNAEGNIMSLINSTGFATATTLTTVYTFFNLFVNCTGLTSAKNLVLPATTLGNACYYQMFRGCTSLITAPSILPATTLKQYCYRQMFAYCSSLTTVPSILPATTLSNGCCRQMFYGCTSLTTAPELPTTTLATNCYYQMFQGCRSLATAPELPATTLADTCYQQMFDGCSSLNYIKCLATNISAYDCTKNWTYGVAATGTFVKNANMTGWTTGTGGIPTGWTVQDAS